MSSISNIQSTIKSTIDDVRTMREKTSQLLMHYDDYADGDKDTVSSVDRKTIKRLWGSDSPSQASVDEWCQHGAIENGKKVIKNGSANL